MKFVKINNLFGLNGQADYKGMNLNNIIAGTQSYSHDDNSCVLGYSGEVSAHPDLTEVTEQEYRLVKQEFESKRPKSELEILKEEQALMKQALDELLLGGGTL